jgi:hypothetical protein
MEEFLFICGVEGTGHQLMLDVFSEYLRGKKNITNQVRKGCFSSASFPYGQPRNSYRRPNISHMVSSTPNDVELKMLILYRDPRYVAYSGYRRKFTTSLLEQCGVVHINFQYIKEEMDKLNPSMYRVIHFEKFVDNPYSYTETITSFLNINKDMLERGFKKIKKSNSSLGDRERILNDFFKNINYGIVN